MLLVVYLSRAANRVHLAREMKCRRFRSLLPLLFTTLHMKAIVKVLQILRSRAVACCNYRPSDFILLTNIQSRLLAAASRHFGNTSVSPPLNTVASFTKWSTRNTTIATVKVTPPGSWA